MCTELVPYERIAKTSKSSDEHGWGFNMARAVILHVLYQQGADMACAVMDTCISMGA